ncbi:MAG: nucleotidyl transferase AbiEii/AbiGii toxin family protein [Bryobacteraceae bacterium]
MSREDGIDLQRLRRQVAFDRFLARLFRGANTNWVLKGGYAMELRFQTARTTKDLDFTVRVPPPGHDDGLLTQLQDAGPWT